MWISISSSMYITLLYSLFYFFLQYRGEILMSSISIPFSSSKTCNSYYLFLIMSNFFFLSDSMYKFHEHLITSVFSRFLTPVKSIYTYIARLASQLLLLFQCVAILMNISSSAAYLFKKKLENFYFDIYPIAGCARGQYEANPVFWLASQAGKMDPSCPLARKKKLRGANLPSL